jgi:hypothetical protein
MSGSSHPPRRLDSNAPVDPNEHERLEVLLLDYEMAREDERSLTNAITTTYSVAVALLALLGAAITQAKSPPEQLLAGAPLLPLAVLTYLEMLGAQATLRSYYMRGLEAELRKYAAAPITTLGQLQPASYIGIAVEMVSLRRGRWGYRVLANFLLTAILVVFGGLTVYIGIHLVDSPRLRIAMALIYGPIAALLLWEVASGTLGGRRLFIHTARRYLRGGAKLPMITRSGGDGPLKRSASAVRERSLFSYLLFPRPEDWVKWLIAPGVFSVTALSTGEWQNWSRFAIVWLTLEYFIYLARYQWNDVRGIAEDAVHAEQVSRGRLPLGGTLATTRRNVVISLGVALLRLGFSVATGWTLGNGWIITLLIATIFGIAMIYEFLRSKVRQPGNEDFRVTWPILGVWIVVSLGYVARASVGLHYGGLSLLARPAIIGMACMAAYGAMFVLLTWILEATSYCRLDTKERAVRGRWYRLDTLNSKAHLGALLTFVDIKTAPQDEAIEIRESITDVNDVTYCGTHRVLERRGHVLAPWNLAFLVSVGFGGIFGLLLSRPIVHTVSACAVAAAICAAGALTSALLSNTPLRVLVVVLVSVASIGPAILAHSQIPLLVFVPWLMLSGTYVGFRRCSYRDLKLLGPAIKSLPPKFFYFVIGGKAARFLSTGIHD